MAFRSIGSMPTTGSTSRTPAIAKAANWQNWRGSGASRGRNLSFRIADYLRTLLRGVGKTLHCRRPALTGRSSIPETAVFNREAAAYWVPRFRGGRQGCVLSHPTIKKPALPPAFRHHLSKPRGSVRGFQRGLFLPGDRAL